MENETQESDPITLEAGEIYYIEAIFKEHEGGDNCAVAWQGPGIPNRVVIPGSYLSPVHDGECTTIAYYIDGLNEQVQLGSRLKVEFAAEPIDAGDLPCEPGGSNQYVFTHETEVDQVIAGMGLNYFGARYYDAEIGLWIAVDPAREFPNPYRYTTNPVGYFDPDGLTDYRIAFYGYHMNNEFASAFKQQVNLQVDFGKKDRFAVRVFEPGQETNMLNWMQNAGRPTGNIDYGPIEAAIGSHAVPSLGGISFQPLLTDKLSFSEMAKAFAGKEDLTVTVEACWIRDWLKEGVFENMRAASGTGGKADVPKGIAKDLFDIELKPLWYEE